MDMANYALLVQDDHSRPHGDVILLVNGRITMLIAENRIFEIEIAYHSVGHGKIGVRVDAEESYWLVLKLISEFDQFRHAAKAPTTA